jgi:8-oxo-dGTP pyrophosphatase MutT (NUDIX family)
MMSTSPRPAPGERWTICTLDHVHWGANGGAGLLLKHTPTEGEPRYLLALRSRWVDEPATWGIPGGGIRDNETPEAAARRETIEEISQLPPHRIVEDEVQDCGGGWRFHILLAEVDVPFDAYSQQETDATGWFTPAEMRQLSLHPGVRRWLDEVDATTRPSQVTRPSEGTSVAPTPRRRR